QVLARTERLFGRPLTPAQAGDEIVASVARGGDGALLAWVERIDGLRLTPAELFVSEEEWEAAYRQVSAADLEAIRTACEHIRAFHSRQIPRDWMMAGPGGSILGQRYVPVERVGVYVPGGRAPLASSALMGV